MQITDLWKGLYLPVCLNLGQNLQLHKLSMTLISNVPLLVIGILN